MKCLCLLLVILVVYWWYKSDSVEGFNPDPTTDYFYYDKNNGLFHKDKISNKNNKMIVQSGSILETVLKKYIGDFNKDKDSSLRLKNIFDHNQPNHPHYNDALNNNVKGFY